jgi:NTE family protein
VKLGLALGGGGARGGAHITVLGALEDAGLRPDLITGTSIGGLVGGLYAAGLSADEMITFFRQVTFGQIFARPGGEPSLTNNSKFTTLLERTIGRPTFDELQVPLAVVAVDLISRREVVLDEGDVVTALLATTAFPIVLPPVTREGQLLVDGGLLNNVPFDVARARGATHVVAVDLSNSLPYGSPAEIPSGSGLVARALAMTQRTALWQVLTTVTDIVTTQSVKARMAISPPDLMIRPEVGTIGIFDFHRLDEGLQAGEQAIEEVEEQLEQLKQKIGEWR